MKEGDVRFRAGLVTGIDHCKYSDRYTLTVVGLDGTEESLWVRDNLEPRYRLEGDWREAGVEACYRQLVHISAVEVDCPVGSWVESWVAVYDLRLADGRDSCPFPREG